VSAAPVGALGAAATVGSFVPLVVSGASSSATIGPIATQNKIIPRSQATRYVLPLNVPHATTPLIDFRSCAGALRFPKQ
jgi:hypothetical protein